MKPSVLSDPTERDLRWQGKSQEGERKIQKTEVGLVRARFNGLRVSDLTTTRRPAQPNAAARYSTLLVSPASFSDASPSLLASFSMPFRVEEKRPTNEPVEHARRR